MLGVQGGATGDLLWPGFLRPECAPDTAWAELNPHHIMFSDDVKVMHTARHACVACFGRLA